MLDLLHRVTIAMILTISRTSGIMLLTPWMDPEHTSFQTSMAMATTLAMKEVTSLLTNVTRLVLELTLRAMKSDSSILLQSM